MKPYYLIDRRCKGNLWIYDLCVFVTEWETLDKDFKGFAELLRDMVIQIKEDTLDYDTSVFASLANVEVYYLLPDAREIYGDYTFCIKTEIQFGLKTDGALASFMFYQNEHVDYEIDFQHNFSPPINV